MTDRELLFAAAKAAGLNPFTAWGKTFVQGDGSPPKPEWNPLTDDGDALRLAVKLGIDISQFPVTEKVEAWAHMSYGLGEDYKGDPYAATRRAIVRAAAEIGKSINP